MIVDALLVRAKLKAFFVHLFITGTIAAGTAVLIFKVWYPSGLANLIGGAGLFKLIVVVEVCLGPLLTLVIFNPDKPKRELLKDYLVVGMIQVSALFYGIFSTFVSRPVFSVFVVDRIELISAVELADSDLLGLVNNEFQRLSISGPKKVCVDLPTDPKQRSELLLSALGGKDVELMPRYYRRCKEGEIRDAALDSDVLINIFESNGLMEELAKVEKLGKFRWMPVKSRFGAWVEVYPQDGDDHSFYIDVDPFLLKY